MKRYVFVRPARNVLIPSKDDVPRPHQEIWTSVLQVHTETIDETPGTSMFVSVRATGLFPNRTGLNWIWFCENLRVALLARLEVWSETPQNTKFISSEWGIIFFHAKKNWYVLVVAQVFQTTTKILPTNSKQKNTLGQTKVLRWCPDGHHQQCLVSANKFCLVR
jgi:hypothetical protein